MQPAVSHLLRLARTASYEDDVGAAHVAESRGHVDRQALEIIVYQARLLRDEDDLGVRQTAQDLVRAEDVERGESGIDNDGDLHVTTPSFCVVDHDPVARDGVGLEDRSAGQRHRRGGRGQ